MALFFIVLQFISLCAQLYFLVKGWKSGDILEQGKGYAIWGGAITVLLGLPVQLGIVT